MAENLKIVIDVDVKDAGDIKSLKGDLTDLGKAGKSAAPGLDAAGKASTGMSNAIKGLVAGGILAAAGQQLIAFGKASIEAASNAQEMQSKFNIVFGDLAGQVTSDLTAFADAANRSQYDLMGFAATLQDTLKPMGIAPDLAADLSTQLVKLGTDLSSFNNMPMDEALRRLQGTLIGSHENALAFGVVINENTLKAELAANGWDKLTGAQLEAAKVQARINLLMAGTSDAQGDAIRTADSYANQVKGMQAAVTDLQVAIGTALLPVMTELVGLVTEAAERLSIAAGMAGEYNTQAQNIIAANIESAKSFDELVTQANKIDDVGNMWGGLATAVTGTNAAFREGIVSVSKDLAGAADSFGEFENVVDGWSARSRTAFNNYLRAQGLTIEEFYNLEKGLRDATVATQGHDAAMLNAVASYQANATAASNAGAAAIEYSRALAEARGENEELADKQAQLANQTGTAEQAILAANLASEQYFAGLEDQKAAAEAAAAAQAELAIATGDNFTALAESEGKFASVNDLMYAAADSAGANAGALALLKVATGDLTQAQAEAIIKQIALEQAITTLAEAYAQGDITLQDYMTAAQQAVTDINNMTVSMDTMTGSVTTSKDEINQLVGVMGEIPSEIATHISITSDPLPNMPTGGTGGSRGTTSGVQSFASGTDGWQTVPGPTGAPYPVTLHGGEAFNVVPVGGGGATTTNNNSNSVNVVQNFTGGSPNTMEQARNGTMAALREAGITGFG